MFLLGGNYTGWANFRSPFTLNSTHSKGSKTSNMILNVLMCAQFLCYNKSKGSFLLPITNLNFCFVPILLRGNNRGSSVNIPWNPCMRILENTRKIFHTNIIWTFWAEVRTAECTVTYYLNMFSFLGAWFQYLRRRGKKLRGGLLLI